MTPLSEVRVSLEKIKTSQGPARASMDGSAENAETYVSRLARKALTHLAEVEAEVAQLKSATTKDNLSGFYEWEIQKHSAEYEIEFRGIELSRLRAELDRVIEINRKFYGRTRYKKLKELRAENTRLRQLSEEILNREWLDVYIGARQKQATIIVSPEQLDIWRAALQSPGEGKP